MNTQSATTATPHDWSRDALFAKAVRFSEQMREYSRDDWRFGMWSTLALEMLARAALSNVSPVLLADQKDWNNLYFALGHQPLAQKFTPHSLDIKGVLNRLAQIVPDFVPELESFAVLHMSRRNEDLHSGASPFDALNTSKWLPKYYRVCQVLLKAIGESLDTFLGGPEAADALQMIAAEKDQNAQLVHKSIAAHANVWQGKTADEREQLKKQASVWSTKHDGHRVPCPACGSDAILIGAPTTAPIVALDAGQVVETQQYLPAKFECIACGLKITGLSQLSAAGLGDTFKSTSTFDVAEYFSLGYADYEPDYNEP